MMSLAMQRSTVGFLCVVVISLFGTGYAKEPRIFDAGFENQMGLTYSPDGQSAFWVEWNGPWGGDGGQRIIYMSQKEGNVWGKPYPAPFTLDQSDDDPFVSLNGDWLYFVSERLVDESDPEADSNIWRFHLIDHRLELLSINSEASEYSPVVTQNGTLYFASDRDGGIGRGDIYKATPTVDGFSDPTNLGATINSKTGEWNVWVSPDETEILFEASSRTTNVSIPGDLYYSWQTQTGWTAPLPVVDLNSVGSDLMPRLHPDGKTLSYTTAPIGGNAKIVTVDWQSLKPQLKATYAPILLVANRSSHEVTFVDLSQGKVVHRNATGEGPHLLSNVDGGRVVATGYGVFPEPHAAPVSKRPPFVESRNSRLTVIDVNNRQVLLDKVIDGCAKPHASWIVGDQVYVTCETHQRVLVVDLDTGSVVKHYDTEQSGSHVLGFVSTTQKLIVTNTQSASLTSIDIESGKTNIVSLGGGSEGLLVVNDQIWVGNGWDGSVSVVDAETESVVKTIDNVCGFPISLTLGSDQHIWVACFASGELIAIDADSLTVKRRVELEHQPLHLLAHPSYPRAYASLPRQNAITEIDLISGQELRRIEVGIEPDGLRWAD